MGLAGSLGRPIEVVRRAIVALVSEGALERAADGTVRLDESAEPQRPASASVGRLPG
jgi:hypothetical protein